MQRIKITVADLESIEACEPGVAWFKNVFGNCLDTDWDHKFQLKLLSLNKDQFVRWAVGRGIMFDYDFREADLCHIRLQGLRASWVDFSRAKLTSANMAVGFFNNSYFSLSDMRFIDAHNVSMRHCNFTGADLTGADLSYADLSGSDFTNADLTGVNLKGTNLNNAELTGAILAHAKLSYTSFRGTILADRSIGPKDLL